MAAITQRFTGSLCRSTIQLPRVEIHRGSQSEREDSTAGLKRSRRAVRGVAPRRIDETEAAILRAPRDFARPNSSVHQTILTTFAGRKNSPRLALEGLNRAG